MPTLESLFSLRTDPPEAVRCSCLIFILGWLADAFAVSLGARGVAPSRFDASFYRTHDPLAYIPSDVQSVKSTYSTSSGIPLFSSHPSTGPFSQAASGRKGNQSYSSYASSIVSQDVAGASDASSIADSTITGGISGVTPSERSSIAFSQSDRLRRRLSLTSLAPSDLGSMYKSDAGHDDDGRSQYSVAQSQAGGFTEF